MDIANLKLEIKKKLDYKFTQKLNEIKELSGFDLNILTFIQILCSIQLAISCLYMIMSSLNISAVVNTIIFSLAFIYIVLKARNLNHDYKAALKNTHNLKTVKNLYETSGNKKNKLVAIAFFLLIGSIAINFISYYFLEINSKSIELLVVIPELILLIGCTMILNSVMCPDSRLAYSYNKNLLFYELFNLHEKELDNSINEVMIENNVKAKNIKESVAREYKNYIKVLKERNETSNEMIVHKQLKDLIKEDLRIL